LKEVLFVAMNKNYDLIAGVKRAKITSMNPWEGAPEEQGWYQVLILGTQ
jgi:hypothetical protein